MRSGMRGVLIHKKSSGLGTAVVSPNHQPLAEAYLARWRSPVVTVLITDRPPQLAAPASFPSENSVFREAIEPLQNKKATYERSS